MIKRISEYKYDEDECDVIDKQLLREFREKRLEWIGWLNEGDNAIWHQIHSMMWFDRLYWTINESRRISTEQKGEFATRSGSLGEFIDHGYFITQLLALRKLMEPSPKSSDRQVVSLHRLLRDLEENRHLITRENYVCYDGSRFDPAEAERAYWAGRPQAGARYEERGGPLDYTSAERAHHQFDAICEGDSANRDRNDRIGQYVLTGLENKLTAAPLGVARILANKRIAHAPDVSSLPKDGLPSLTFKDLWKCQQAICEVTGFVSAIIVDESTHGIVPEPNLDIFERWDQPFVPAGADQELRNIWDETSRDRNRWGNENVSKMLEDMRSKS